MNSIVKLQLNNTDTKNISRHLKFLMKDAGLTECELARVINLPVMTIRRIVSGETTDPRISTLKLFADYFKLSLDELIYGTYRQAIHPINPKSQPKFIPILEWADIENETIFYSIDKLTWGNWHPISVNNDDDDVNNECLAILAKPTMQPRFPQGTLLILNQNIFPHDGDLVLTRFSNGDISLREYIIDSPNKILYPTMQGSEPLIFNEAQHRILGVIVLTIMFPRRK